MAKTLFEFTAPFLPVDFFTVELQAKLGKELSLPDTSELLGEEHFAKVSLSPSQVGIRIKADVRKPFEETQYPDYDKGDSLELFIDTRDLKTAGFMTRFCHHFLILPQSENGVTSREVTRFRTEDTHPLCDPADLEVTMKPSSSRYALDVFIPAQALHGYDPSAFKRLGFTFRLNRYRGDPQHFVLSSKLYKITDHPSYWASIELK